VAISPTIPTSFVPKQPVSTGVRRPQSGLNAFLIIAGVVAGLAVLAAGATFGYKTYLESVRTSKAEALKAAEQDINLDVVEGFIRLRNRLNSAQALLDQHVLTSQFFDTIEVRTLQTVRFNSLTLTVADDRSAEIQMEGVAKSFNALAAQSEAFASEKRIKRAIFSSIAVKENGTVGFTLSAELDPRLVLASTAPTPPEQQNVPVAAPVAPIQATTTPATPASTTPKKP
jgi:hypothetical protein